MNDMPLRVVNKDNEVEELNGLDGCATASSHAKEEGAK